MTRNVNFQHVLTCRIDDSDMRVLEEQSEGMGMSKSQYLRYLIRVPIEVKETGGEAVVIDTVSVDSLRRELRKWGYHYNQGIHALNALALASRHKGIDPDYFEQQIAVVQSQLDEACAGAADISSRLDRLEESIAIRGD